MTMRRFPRSVLFALICAFATSAQALEIRGTVSAVAADGQVTITLPEGATVATGDEVRIEADLPGIGPVAIESRWRVERAGAGTAVAVPQGTPTGEPQAGYAAVIETASEQRTAGAPENAPQEEAAAPVIVAPGPATPALTPPETAESTTATAETSRLTPPPSQPPPSAPDGVAFVPPPSRPPRSVPAIPAPQAAIPETQCDRLTNVPFERMRGDDAMWACRSAVSAYPNVPQFAFRLAEAQRRRGHLGEAIVWYGKASEAGLYSATATIAAFYEKGQGLAPNPEQAAAWYRKAAVQAYAAAGQGDAGAMRLLGFLNAHGQGVPRDYAQAVSWNRKAVEKGDALAMAGLAELYFNGQGVAQDAGEAAYLWRRAAELGVSNAMHNLGALYDKGNGVPRNPQAAAQWIFRALQQGDAGSIQQMRQNSGAYTAEFRTALQRLLQSAGVYSGAVDGNFGPATLHAIEALAKP